MIPLVEVNYLAIIVAAIVGTIIGALWYGVIFSKPWMRLHGFDKLAKSELDKMKKKGHKSMIGHFIVLLIIGYALAHMLAYAQVATIAESIIGAVWIWFGFMATVIFGAVLWEKMPIKLYVINAAHYLVVLAVMAVIITAWV